MMASVYLTISLTVERYFSVVKPFLHLGNRWAPELFVGRRSYIAGGNWEPRYLFAVKPFFHLGNRWAP
jgi:hypothetical protein